MAANHASTLTAHAFNKSGNSEEQIQRKMLLIAHDFPTFSHSVVFQRFLYFTHPLQVNHHSVLFLMVPTCGLYPRDTEIMNGTINPCDAQKKKTTCIWSADKGCSHTSSKWLFREGSSVKKVITAEVKCFQRSCCCRRRERTERRRRHHQVDLKHWTHNTGGRDRFSTSSAVPQDISSSHLPPWLSSFVQIMSHASCGLQNV